ncbi:MAG: response regulator [Armatimonadetes bacterium]|nr:response regulator [Armatimonadota bacterium]
MADGDGKKILIVEDDPDTVEAVKLVLEKHGYAVISAPNAEEGLKSAQTERPDLVLLDVMMPAGTEGFHFVWALRKEEDEALRDTPIIVLTAIHETSPLKLYPEQQDSTYSPYEYLPVQGFFDKPVDMEKLLAELKKQLGGDKAEPEKS